MESPTFTALVERVGSIKALSDIIQQCGASLAAAPADRTQLRPFLHDLLLSNNQLLRQVSDRVYATGTTLCTTPSATRASSVGACASSGGNSMSSGDPMLLQQQKKLAELMEEDEDDAVILLPGAVASEMVSGSLGTCAASAPSAMATVVTAMPVAHSEPTAVPVGSTSGDGTAMPPPEAAMASPGVPSGLLYSAEQVSALDVSRKRLLALQLVNRVRSGAATTDAIPSTESIPLLDRWSHHSIDFDKFTAFPARDMTVLTSGMRIAVGLPRVASFHPVLMNVARSDADKALLRLAADAQHAFRRDLSLLNEVGSILVQSGASESHPVFGVLDLLATSFRAQTAATLDTVRSYLRRQVDDQRQPMALKAYSSKVDRLVREQAPRTIGASLDGFDSVEALQERGILSRRRFNSGRGRRFRRGGGSSWSGSSASSSNAPATGAGSSSRPSRPQQFFRGRGRGRGHGQGRPSGDAPASN